MKESSIHKSIHKDVLVAIDSFFQHQDQWGMSLSGTEAVYRLERKFQSLVGLPHALSVCNATLGLWAIIKALEIRDAEIITTPLSWGGSLSGAICEGNRPVFVDVREDDLTLDPEKVAKAITRQTRAILAVDLYGNPSDGMALRKIADKHGLALIQDCAQSFGAYREGNHTGRNADAAVFSFTSGKALFAGEGAMVLARDEELYRRLVRLTQHPHRQRRDCSKMPINEMGMNLRIHPLAAVWTEVTFNPVLAGLEKYRSKCLKILNFLNEERLIRSGLPNWRTVQPAFHALTIDPAGDPAKIESALNEKGWPYRSAPPPIVAPLYDQEVFRRLSRSRRWERPIPCPVAEKQCRRRIRLAAIGDLSRNTSTKTYHGGET